MIKVHTSIYVGKISEFNTLPAALDFNARLDAKNIPTKFVMDNSGTDKPFKVVQIIGPNDGGVL